MGAALAIARKFNNEELSKDKERILPHACFTHQKQAIICNSYNVSGLINSALDGTMEALANPNISIVWVYGSSTLRKNNLVEKISRRVKRDNLFDVIVMASVKEKPNLKRIQGELGNMLGLEFDEESVVGRAKLLCDRIKEEDRILVILDDLRAGINLDRVGIPFGNDHKGCKIVLISKCLDSRGIVQPNEHCNKFSLASLSSKEHLQFVCNRNTKAKELN